MHRIKDALVPSRRKYAEAEKGAEEVLFS